MRGASYASSLFYSVISEGERESSGGRVSWTVNEEREWWWRERSSQSALTSAQPCRLCLEAAEVHVSSGLLLVCVCVCV